MTPQRIASWRANLIVYVRLTLLLRSHLLSSLGTVVCVLLSTVFALVIPLLLQWVIDTGVQRNHVNDLLLAALLIVVASVLRGLCAYGQGYLSQAVSQEVAYDLRATIYDHLQRLSFAFHDRSETGQLMSRLTVDIEAVRNFLILGLLRLVVALATFGAVAFLLIQADVRLALLTLASVPVLTLLSVYVARRLHPLWLAIQDETGALSTVMQESLSGMRVVKSFAREPYEMAKFDAKNREVRLLSLDAMRISAWNQPLMSLILNLITIAVLWLGGVSVIDGRMSKGALVAIVTYVLLLGAPVRTFGFMVTWMTRGLSSGVRIFEVLDAAPDIVDKPQALALTAVRGEVRLEEVSFAYGEGPEVLHDLSVAAQPGQVVALLGSTGSGKSTILHLLPRFYDVTRGRITIDGHDVRDLTLASLRENIGLVMQDVFLFNATLRENIAYGVGAVSDVQIVAAARAARLHDFILTLPDGYDTWVGERGVTLSGGQKQRVAIARTLLRDPRILVLDDSTSSVDMETEYLIQQALTEVMRGRTTFVVASRLRTIKSADLIVVLEDGRIVERGTHATLLAQAGAYARLYDLQLRDQDEHEERQERAVESGVRR